MRITFKQRESLLEMAYGSQRTIFCCVFTSSLLGCFLLDMAIPFMNNQNFCQDVKFLPNLFGEEQSPQCLPFLAGTSNQCVHLTLSSLTLVSDRSYRCHFRRSIARVAAQPLRFSFACRATCAWVCRVAFSPV